MEKRFIPFGLILHLDLNLDSLDGRLDDLGLGLTGAEPLTGLSGEAHGADVAPRKRVLANLNYSL